ERSSSVAISVTNESGIPLEGLTAELLSAKDSVLRKTVLSDQKGIILFDDLSDGTYLVKVTGVTYKNFTSAAFAIKDQEKIELPLIKLQNATAGQLQSVTVVSQ